MMTNQNQADSSATAPNPFYTAYGSPQMRWVEAGEKPTLRDALDYTNRRAACKFRHNTTTGYYCDNYGDELAVPAVLVITSQTASDDDEEYEETFTYYPAVRDPYNAGCATVDFETPYDDAEEAAHTAHQLAERYADEAREYNDLENAKLGLEAAIDSIGQLRRDHSRLIAVDDATGMRARIHIRRELSAIIAQIRDLRLRIS